MARTHTRARNTRSSAHTHTHSSWWCRQSPGNISSQSAHAREDLGISESNFPAISYSHAGKAASAAIAAHSQTTPKLPRVCVCVYVRWHCTLYGYDEVIYSSGALARTPKAPAPRYCTLSSFACVCVCILYMRAVSSIDYATNCRTSRPGTIRQKE